MNIVTKLIRQNEMLYTAAREARDIFSYLKGARRGSFSQHGEDAFFQEKFRYKTDGFYVDIGASHPFRLSNTFLLYKKGWRGVTVEPIPLLGHLHSRWRCEDTLVQMAIGPTPGKLRFFEMFPSVLSTLDAKTAETLVSENKAQLLRCLDIDVMTLSQLFSDYVGTRDVDLLSIDIEGLDAEIITTFDLNVIRPKVICIEANNTVYRNNILTYLHRHRYQTVAELGVNLIVEDVLTSE